VTVSRTDESASTPFGTEFDGEEVRVDRLRVVFDRWVRAPAAILWEDGRARVGATIVLGYLLMGTLGVVVVATPIGSGPRLAGPFDPAYARPLVGLAPVTIDLGTVSWTYTGVWVYPFGTDYVGRGILAQVVHATPAMLKMIAAGAVFSTAMATVVGTVSGYKGGVLDRLLMTVTDVLMTIPGLPLTIVIVALVQPRDPFVVGLLLAVNDWSGLARSIRSQVLTLRDENYVEASRILGVGTPGVIRTDVLPNLMPYVTINFVKSARSIIFASVGLYFLGILPFSTFNWGVMMNLAYSTAGALYTLRTAHYLLFPMATVILLSFGLILLAQGLDRVFNPRVRARHARTMTDDDATDAGTDDDGPAVAELIRR
jgi:peptide/nickel transport system permease protein